MPNPTPPAEVDVAEGRRLLESATPGPWAMEYSESGAGPDRHLVAFVMGADEAYVLVDESPDAIDGPPSPNGELAVWMRNNLPALLTAAEQVAGLRETILSAANICEHWADESRNGGWSTHQVEPNRRLAASLRKAALGAAP